MLEKSNINKVLAIIFSQPTVKFTVRELARFTKLAPPTVSGFVRELLLEQIIRESHVARASQISANLESISYKRAKVLHNVYSLFNSGLLDFLIDAYEDPKAIILFGSYVRGEDIERSDIDLAILTSKHKNLNIQRFGKQLGRKISIHEITLNNVSEEFKNNLFNGIVLHGAI